MTQRYQRWLGAAFWIGLIMIGAVWLLSETRRSTQLKTAAVAHASPASMIFASIWSPTEHIELEDPSGVVRVGDVAFAPQDNGWREVGYVTAVVPAKNAANRLTLAIFDPVAASRDATFTVHRNSGRLGDVMTTLLPPDKRERLQAKLVAAMEAHANAVAHEILPLVAESIQTSIPLIETALVEAINRHESEIDSLIARYREEIVRERLVPLVREEVMPVVRKHGTEPAETIGREIWNRASLWRFGWRAMYDKSPLPERELVAGEWERFVDEEVTPIVEAHLDDIATAVENIVKDLAASKKLRGELAQVVSMIAHDPEARELLRTILREAIVDNQPLRQAWANVWSSPAAKERLRRSGKRLEPILREIADELMGTRESGIEPGFARVLRNQILSKDRTWITITPRHEETGRQGDKERGRQGDEERGRQGDKETGRQGDRESGRRIVLREATKFMPYPVVYLAK